MKKYEEQQNNKPNQKDNEATLTDEQKLKRMKIVFGKLKL
jgi:hypothetical protein